MRHGNNKKLNLEKIRKGIILFILFSLFIVVSGVFIKTFLIKRINSIEKVSLRNVCFSLSGINLKNITYKTSKFSVNINNFKIKPFIIQKAFAFQGPGQIISEKEKKKVEIQGKMKGDIKRGNLNITGTDVNVENTGSLRFYGIIENWGKGKFEGTIELDGIKIKEILELIEFKIPFDGNVYGKIFIEKEKENIKDIKFNLEVKDFSGGEKDLFNLVLKGIYIPDQHIWIIEEGVLKNEKGEKLVFTGFLSEKEIEFSFNTKEFSLDEFLKLLPDEIKKKYNIKIETSKIKLDKFNLNISKKKFLFLEIYCLKQNLLELKIWNLKT
ncbi:MAG: hypothetical protein NC915_00345 [Candidatus Omnitrophica bacterium]|nr:hypothetical protein [Candidatus Omnitrophota bacterium]